MMRLQSRTTNWLLLTIESPVAQWLEHPTRSRGRGFKSHLGLGFFVKNVICLLTDWPRRSKELVKKCPCIPGSNWNLEMLVFKERGKPEYPDKNLSEQSTNDKLKPYMTPGPGIKPGTHWWEASAVTTEPTLLPFFRVLLTYNINFEFKLQNIRGRQCRNDPWIRNKSLADIQHWI